MEVLNRPYQVFVRLLVVMAMIEAGIMYLLIPIVPDFFPKVILDALLLPALAAPFIWSAIIHPLREVAVKEMDRNRMSEERYRALFANMPGGFAFCRMIYDDDGNPADFLHLAVNDSFRRILKAPEVVGKKVSELFPELVKVHPELIAAYGRVVSTGTPESFEFDLTLFGLWLSISVYSPEPEHFVAVFEDITARKKAEGEMVAAREEWERTFDAIVDPVMILGLQHEIVRANKAMTALIGETVAHGGELLCNHCYHGKGPYPHFCPHTKLLQDARPHSEVVHLPELGLHLEVVVSPLFDREGKLQGSIHYARDITEQKKLEQQLQQSQKLEAIGTLAGGVAHDFNNILTAIIGYGAMLDQHMEPGTEAASQLKGIMKAADRAAALTRSLLSFSRKRELELKPVDLNQVIAEASELLKRLVRGDIVVSCDLARHSLPVMGDLGQIEQVLMNLISNAQDAIEGAGAVTIGTESVTIDDAFVSQNGFGTPGRYALITCTDTGTGMEESVAQRVFEPFFTTKAVGKGTGLGLSMVYGIVKQHNGYICCVSRPRMGTTFRIYLPLVKAAAAETALPRPGDWATGTETILLAEDDDQIRFLLSQVLTRSGYRVIAANHGKDAVAQFIRNNGAIDLLVSDVVMPGMNGMEAFRQMQAIRPELKAVFMSGCNTDNLPVAEALAGNGTFLHKPLPPQALLAEVRKWLR
ncbi:response regulator [Geomonas sp. Red32]|uniref:PAS domain-containing hybrid sensor histidine kinase/response regulator n=1 Tax=Geomonas sp. Red32 TaxID=2912856 RepID=UPI00202CB110|nr:ATP-binding protein [Geomonas sp. Red32]MCM0080720.1 response regulator [Geomonas sp. Red32]